MAPYLLPSLVQTIKGAYPNVQLHLHEDQTNELLRRADQLAWCGAQVHLLANISRVLLRN
jgi:hypothetical protein